MGRAVLSTLEGVLILSLLLAVGYAAYGYWEWRTVRNDLLARGEKLSLAEFAPPAVPDEENFFADSIWREVAQRQAAAREQIQLAVLNAKPSESELEALRVEYPTVRWRNASTNTRLAIARAAWHYRAPGFTLNKEETAAFTLELLKPMDPLLAKIDALSLRKDGQIPMDYQDAAAAREYPMAGYFYGLSETLYLRAQAKLALGDRSGAFEAVASLARLTQALENEPLMMPLQMRRTFSDRLTSAIREGLVKQEWSEVDLRSFEAMLAPIDLLTQLPLAIRCERAASNEYLNARLFDSEKPAEDAWTNFSYSVVRRSYDFLISGYEKAFLNQHIQQELAIIDKAPTEGFGASKLREASAEEKNTMENAHPYAALYQSDAVTIARSVALAQTNINQTRIACALEQYRLVNDDYPETLEALVPEYLPSVPLDVINLKPMRYTLVKPDEFRLWSVGWNETDEGGVDQGYDRKKGDWGWQRIGLR